MRVVIIFDSHFFYITNKIYLSILEFINSPVFVTFLA